MSAEFQRRLPSHQDLAGRRRRLGLRLDPWMLLLLLMTLGYGLTVLYSAVEQSPRAFGNQAIRVGMALVLMLTIAQLSPALFRRWTPWVYGGGIVLLSLVFVFGVEVNGSRRWLDFPALPRFQPSELLKLAVPMMVAWYFADRALPASLLQTATVLGIILLPVGLIVMQPDLGTGILVAGAGMAGVFLAGLQWRWIVLAVVSAAASAPLLWMGLRDYQKQRVMTLIDPERDPLGAGWNILQSTTAIGSGGLQGKGLFGGTQSHLDFLPESQTDFIIAVMAEELGFIGVATLIMLYFLILVRGLWVAANAQETYERLLAGCIVFTFFMYAFVNMAMVSGLLPVVGVPLPLVSYGGTSMLTLLAGFGLLMSIHTHRYRITR